MTPDQREWSRTRDELEDAVASLGFPKELGDAMAKNLGRRLFPIYRRTAKIRELYVQDEVVEGIFELYRLREVFVVNKGTKLCVISLLCMFLAPIVIFLIAGTFMSGDISGATASAYGVMIPLDIASYIAAWILAIISRVKYKNRFSLVLIIIYGSILALSLIGIIVLFCVFMGLF